MTLNDLVEFYRAKKAKSRLWYLTSPTAKAGNLVVRYGEGALAQAALLLDQASEQMWSYYRQVYGILQDCVCPDMEGK